MRILGVDIPDNKKLAYALPYIYGIGLSRAQQIVDKAGLDPNKRVYTLSEEELNKILAAIDQLGYVLEGDLRRDIAGNIKRLELIKCYRGIRHIKGLPVRGQRTSTNARTRKGARKTVGVVSKANKK